MSALQSFRQWAAGSTVFHVAFGFVLMGGWAMFANRNHTLPEMLLAGLVQGAISGTLTLFLKKGLERMSAVFFRAPASDEGQGRNIAALVVPPVITAASIFAILFTAHTLAGTPEVGATISFPFAVSTTYAILYNLRLWRAAHGR
jgi:hypothetical protein